MTRSAIKLSMGFALGLMTAAAAPAAAGCVNLGGFTICDNQPSGPPLNQAPNGFFGGRIIQGTPTQGPTNQGVHPGMPEEWCCHTPYGRIEGLSQICRPTQAEALALTKQDAAAKHLSDHIVCFARPKT